MPFTPEAAGGIGERIDAKTVDASGLDPPHRVLGLIALDVGTIVVEVGQHPEEPAFHGVFLLRGGGVGIGEHAEVVAERIVMGEGAVEPAILGRVFDPRMLGADVIGHIVFVHADALGAGGGDQALIIGEGAQMFVHGIEIDGAVAVIIAGRVVGVVHHRSEPQYCHSQLLEIRQVRLDAGEIAAVVGARLGAIDGDGVGGAIVREIAVGEAVGHDEVEQVVSAERLRLGRGARLDEEVDRPGAQRRTQAQNGGSGLGALGAGEIHEVIKTIFAGPLRRNGDTGGR